MSELVRSNKYITGEEERLTFKCDDCEKNRKCFSCLAIISKNKWKVLHCDHFTCEHVAKFETQSCIGKPPQHLILDRGQDRRDVNHEATNNTLFDSIIFMQKIYEPACIVVHTGFGGGHFLAIIKIGGDWIEMSDVDVNLVQSQTLHPTIPGVWNFVVYTLQAYNCQQVSDSDDHASSPCFDQFKPLPLSALKQVILSLYILYVLNIYSIFKYINIYLYIYQDKYLYMCVHTCMRSKTISIYYSIIDLSL